MDDSQPNTPAPKKGESPIDQLFADIDIGLTLPPLQTDYLSLIQELGFRQDPFDAIVDPVTDKRLERYAELPFLLQMLIRAYRDFPAAIFYGPAGVGKTLAAKILAAKEPGYLFIDASHRQDILTLEARIQSAKLVIIDNSAPSWLSSPFLRDGELANAFVENMPKVIALLSYFDWRRLNENAKKKGWTNLPFLGLTSYSEFVISPLSVSSIASILSKRIEQSGNAEGVFSIEGIAEISHHSLGLPSLALQIAKESLAEYAKTSRSKKIDRVFVREVLKSSPFAIAYALVSSARTAEVKVSDQMDSQIKLRIGETRREILETMAYRSLPIGADRSSPSRIERKVLETQLVEVGAIKHSSTLSFHTGKLAEAGFIQTERLGNAVAYYLPSPIYHASELLAFQRLNGE